MNISHLLNPVSSSESDQDILDHSPPSSSFSPAHKTSAVHSHAPSHRHHYHTHHHHPHHQRDYLPDDSSSHARKRANADSVEHLESLSGQGHLPPNHPSRHQSHSHHHHYHRHHHQHGHAHVPTVSSRQIQPPQSQHQQLSDYTHANHHDIKNHHSRPYSHSDQNFNTHALRNSNQPPTPGEDPSVSIMSLPPLVDRDRPLHMDQDRDSHGPSSPQIHASSTLSNHKRKYVRRAASIVIPSRFDPGDSAAVENASNSSISGQAGPQVVKSPSQSRSPSDGSFLSSQGSSTPSATSMDSACPARPQEGSNSSNSPNASNISINSSGNSSEGTPKFERNADGKFRCTWPRCGKEFPLESRLSTHYRIHSGKPPYPCGYPGCHKAFHTSSSLSHHRVVHTDQGLRPYVCRHNRCGATYTQLARLITHQRTTHSGMVLSTSQEEALFLTPRPSERVSNDAYPSKPSTEYTEPVPANATAPVESSAQRTTNQPKQPSTASPARSGSSSSSSSSSDSGRTPKSRVSVPSIIKKEQDTGSVDAEDSDDMQQRREAAMTMASLRELATMSTRHSPPPPIPSSRPTQRQHYQQQHYQQQQEDERHQQPPSTRYQPQERRQQHQEYQQHQQQRQHQPASHEYHHLFQRPSRRSN